MKKLLEILTPAEKKKAVFLAALMIGHAFLEVTGIASIAPFLAVLGDPAAIQKHEGLAKAYDILGFESAAAFVTFLGIVAFGVLILSSAFKALVYYLKVRFANMRRYTLATRLVRKYTEQPYPFFLQRNTNEMAKVAFSEVDNVVANGILPVLDIVSYGVVSVAIVLLLVAVSPIVAFSVGGFFLFFYLLLYLRFKNSVHKMGVLRKEAQTTLYKTLSEILGGIKELKVLGNEEAYLDKFRPASLAFARFQTGAQVISELPRYVVEALGFCVSFGVIIFLLKQGKSLSEILPVVGIYVFAGYRLLPAMQNIYGALTKLKYGLSSLDTVHHDFTSIKPAAPAPDVSPDERLCLHDRLVFDNVDYSYPGSDRKALDGISFVLRAKSSLGIIGTTGAGKSTLIDVILGLLPYGAGAVTVDGVTLSEGNARQWQNNIGYVPQHIFLSDDTVMRNIAFGIADKDIDMDKVVLAATMAQIHGFISADLPQGYNTGIGERGIRLSGGQRQRIGIARALYHNPDILIFDEATSALDSETEREVMASIENLTGQKSIIIVTHRLDTIRTCDQTIAIERGKIKDITGNHTAAGGENSHAAR